MKITKKKFLENLSNIHDPVERIEYTSKFFNKIGKGGSSRRCFQWSKTRILKVAYNEKGIAQNKAEIDIDRFYSDEFPILAKIYNSIWDGYWIIQELIPQNIYCPTVYKHKKIIKTINRLESCCDLCYGDLINSCGMKNNQIKIYDYGCTKSIAKEYYQ